MEAEAPPAADATPERRLVLAVVARALLDATAGGQALAWLETEAFTLWCEVVDLPAGLLRQAVQAEPERVKRFARSLGGI